MFIERVHAQQGGAVMFHSHMQIKLQLIILPLPLRGWLTETLSNDKHAIVLQSPRWQENWEESAQWMICECNSGGTIGYGEH